jgi:hypothetical protein
MARSAAKEYNDTGPATFPDPTKTPMLYTIAIVLIVLWLLGLVTSSAMGGFIHVLLVIAVVLILVRLISGRKVV